jgi:hypothetical protein
MNREHVMFKHPSALAVMAVALTSASLSICAQSQTSHQQLARDIHKELVEINTVTATGNTLEAAQAMADRLKAAGFPDADVRVLSPAPRKGNLVARLRVRVLESRSCCSRISTLSTPSRKTGRWILSN